MEENTHTCPAPGCTRQVARRKLMCFDHWRLVSAPTQQAVLLAYHTLPGGEDHRVAIYRAIREVSRKLGEKERDSGTTG